ncbi:putative mitochondrial protein [Trifolium repens]|nr:putative mitochondrial protein [Trifolium repens]
MTLPDSDTKIILEILHKKLPNLFRVPPSPLELQPDLTVVQVQKVVDSHALIKKGKEILDHANKFNVFRTVVNTATVQIYDPKLDRFVLKYKKLKIEGGEGSCRFNWIQHNLRLIIGLLTNKLFLPKRGFYYTDKKLFNDDQRNSDGAIEDIVVLLNCTRDSLPVYAKPRGSVVGDLQFNYNGKAIDYKHADKLGDSILVDNITDMESTTTLFILVVESNVTLSDLHSAKVQETYRCIIVSGSGVPDTLTRKFLRRVSLTLKLPVLALTDGDTYGFLILLNYNKGSKQMAYDSENLATPNMYWLGVRPSDRRRYSIPDGYIKSLTDKELECVRSLLQKPYVKNNVDWTKELRIMLKTQTKIEIEATHSISVKWLTETYLPKKLKSKRWWHKQSPRAWFEKFTQSMKKQGYIQGQADHTLFTKFSPHGKIAILIVYVDDIVLTGDDIVEMAKVKEKLAVDFEIKDLGSMRYFLGIEVARSKDGSVPIDTGRYQRLVGKLIYLSHTRPDIAFSVSVVSQIMHSSFEEHLEAVYRILRYLKANPRKGLFFKKTSERNVSIFTDVDWAGSVTDRRSTSGYCTYVWGNLVTWRSKKQGVVARSSAEVEFRAMAQGICEGLWIHRVLEELKMKIELPSKLYSDSKAAISIAHNPIQHDKTKHIEIDRHFIKEKLDAGIICLPFVTSSQQTADILTKSLARPTFEHLIGKLGMIDIYAPT